MWKNIIGGAQFKALVTSAVLTANLPLRSETNIMVHSDLSACPGLVCRLTSTAQVGTHADSLIAEAVLKGITGFDLDLAWEAVYKDATVPPKDDNVTV